MRQTFEWKKAAGHGWFPLWLILGFALAVMLLVNSISNYVLFSRRIVLDHTRQGIAQRMTEIDASLHRAGFDNAERLDALLEKIRAESDGTILWLQMRDGEGAVVAHAGPDRAPVFSDRLLHSRFRLRQAAYTTFESASGSAVVEAFPLHFALPSASVSFHAIALGRARERSRERGVIEIAALIQADSNAVWPLRRNLLINSSAASVLLLALTMMGVRFPAYVEGRKVEGQLEIARRVQAHMLPSVNQRAAPPFDVAADCQSAAHVGGDFYDVFPAAAGGSAFLIGDVCGKGIPAALLMGVMHGAARSSEWTGCASRHEEATARLNRLLCDRAPRERYATMFWSYFDPQTRLLHYINAGHSTPILLRANGGKVERLDAGGAVLGLLRDAAYRQAAIPFEPGDLLVAYSDGILEAANDADEQFGEERILRAMTDAADTSASGVRDRILAAVRLFTGNAELADDRTLLVVRSLTPA